MKRSKFVALILSSVLTIGCTKANAELLTNATESPTHEVNSTETGQETSESNTQGDITNAIFEKVSYEELSISEQIYKALYNITDFERYVCFDICNDVDINNIKYVEKLYFPSEIIPDDKVGTIRFDTFFKVVKSKMSDGISLTEWIDSFASEKCASCDLSDWFEKNFFLQDGEIYAYIYLVDRATGWCQTSNVTLNEIAALDDFTLKMTFSYTDYGIIGFETEEAKSFEIIMSNKDGSWKIDNYNPDDWRGALVNEFFFNEQESDLLTQIEKYLSENPIS